MDNKQFLTASELAKLAGVSRQFITSQCREGKIRAEKVGRDWVIARVEAERWLALRQ